VGSIAPQGLEPLLQSIHDCLRSTDWATRKAAADALTALALHSSSLIADGVAISTLTVLEACRFDKVPYLNCFPSTYCFFACSFYWINDYSWLSHFNNFQERWASLGFYDCIVEFMLDGLMNTFYLMFLVTLLRHKLSCV
jgi:hypothetical protein